MTETDSNWIYLQTEVCDPGLFVSVSGASARPKKSTRVQGQWVLDAGHCLSVTSCVSISQAFSLSQP